MLGDGRKNMVNWKRIFGNEIIEFYCHPNVEGIIPEPRPAIKNLPEWFKNLNQVCEGPRDAFGNKPMSAKKCLPLIDAMSFGFSIPLCGDIHVRTNHNCSQIEVTNPPGLKVCEFHNADQVGGPSALGINHGNPLKFINYWVVKTAPGWSSLFIPPLNHFDRPFTCLGGMVDTDKYPKEVNFPAAWSVPDYDDTIPSGTPLVTVIPIKRDSFNNKKAKVRKMSNKEMQNISKIQRIQDIRSHHYTYELRVKK